MIEFKTDSIHGPMKSSFGVKQGVPFRGQDGEMLHVSPSQLSAEIEILLVYLYHFFIFFTSMAIMNSTCTKAASQGCSNTYFASSASANTPAASGAAAEVPECVLVHLPYKSVVATPVLGSLAPLENVDASVEEQDSS